MSKADRLELLAPLSGLVVPIESIPDPVFSQKMVGDGVSIDPLSDRLLAPCDATVLQVHPSGHAVTLEVAGGVELLIHVGLDTVELRGAGFTPRVAAGDRVRSGTELIAFDADYVATHARSLLTEVVVTNGDRVASMTAATGRVEAGKDTLLELTLDGATAAASAPDAAGAAGAAASVVSDPVRVANETGLHARPAAVLASAAKRFAADVRIRKGAAEANAKSVVALMGLEVGRDDEVVVAASGGDAAAAVGEIVALLESGLGEGAGATAGRRAATPVAGAATPGPPPGGAPRVVDTGDPSLVAGVPASPGLAVGTVVQVRREEVVVVETASDPHRERRALDAALDRARTELEAMQSRMTARADAGKAAIFEAHEELLDDPDLLELAWRDIDAGKSAAFAWNHAVATHAARLEGLASALLAARANDLRDVGRRVLRALSGVEEAGAPDVYPEAAVLVAEDLSPSETANLDPTRVRGFCTVLGGATSHVAILARALGIPAVAGVDARLLDVADGTPVVLDGTRGTVRLDPPAEEVERVRREQREADERRRADLARAHEPAVTTDGHRVEVAANAGGVEDARRAVELGGEGVGLLRSEFLFMERASAPDEEEQLEAYSAVAAALGPERPLVVRTLDVGGDKPLSYLPMPAEENPFLGVRGLRVGLERPEMLRAQLRAILRAAGSGKLLVMFPMVATLSELRAARAMLEEERERLGADPVPVGVMVEVPSTAVRARQFAREVDFFSIGTNDLTQYTLAMDRGHPKLAPMVDALDPAVLALVASTVEAAHAEGKWVGVCGGVASDEDAVPILVGLGVDELSVSVPAIPAVKARVRGLSLEACRDAARRALECATAEEVRAIGAALAPRGGAG